MSNIEERARLTSFLDDLDDYVDILVKLQITANQFLLCYCLYFDKLYRSKGILLNRNKDSARPVALIIKYSEMVSNPNHLEGKAWTKVEIQSLVNKGYLRNSNAPGEWKPDLLDVTDKFINEVIVTDSMFQEMWDEYPPFIPNFKGTHLPDINLKITDKDALEKLYIKKVKSKKKHQQIIKLIRYLKEKGKLTFAIQKFVESEAWQYYLDELRKRQQRRAFNK